MKIPTIETKLEFDPIEHTYTDENGRILLSVTQLLKKHNLSPNYTFVNQRVLSKASERGTLIHKELEDYIKYGDVGFTEEYYHFSTMWDEYRKDWQVSEQMLCTDVYAGTCDLIWEFNGKVCIGDFKTTSTIHKESCSWQLSLYAYAFQKMTGRFVDGLYIFHYPSNAKFKGATPIERIPVDEIEKLLDCERCGILYDPPKTEVKELITYELQNEAISVFNAISALETELKELKETQEVVKVELMKAMLEHGVKKIEFNGLSATLVSATTKTMFDSKKLQKEKPEIYNCYTYETSVKPSLRVTVK